MSVVAVATRRTPKTSARGSFRLAAIDVGSNSIHMIVAQADADGGVTTLWRLKEPVGLGRTSFPSRRLSRDAIDRAINTLRHFKQAALRRQCEKIACIATSAVREAINGGDLLVRARRELKLFVKVISAREEARLIYLGVRHAVPLRHEPHLIIDIGGGSVEFIVGDERRAVLLESRKLGAARMTARFVKTDPISNEDREALLRHYDRELTSLCQEIESLHPVKVIGTSGTLENIAAMCGQDVIETNGDGVIGIIERKPLEKLLDRLLRSTSAERAEIRGLDDQRKDQIVAGTLLVGELFKRLRLRRIHLCGAALREGVLIDYISRHLPDMAIRRDVPDPRRRSVIDLARRCDWHKTHSEQVARLTMRLFDELKSLHRMGNLERELIEFGALLHDIGWHIGRKGHHKHSMYLVLNGDLKNFSAEEINIIANIARYHRKSEPTRKHAAFDALSASGRRIVCVGAALLRIADGLDRSHAGVVNDLRCRTNGKTVRVIISAKSDAALELWGAQRKNGLFEKVFGRELTVSPERK